MASAALNMDEGSDTTTQSDSVEEEEKKEGKTESRGRRMEGDRRADQ